MELRAFNLEPTRAKRAPALDRRVCEQALKAKDPRFDGRFFIGVKTTGIYCRPVCPVKSPKVGNVLFFPTAAAASEAGFRPCLRCRPESSPGTPAWAGTSTTVQRGLRLIGEGALDSGGVEALSDRLGVTPRHLSRLFMQHLGASPKAIAQTRRLHFAKKLLNETALSMTEIALASGYGSVRRFNDHVQQVYGRSPSALRGRAAARAEAKADSTFVLRLPYRPPYDFAGMLEFLRRRATPGIEAVADGRYVRSITLGDERGTLAVSQVSGQNQLLCEIDLPDSRRLMQAVDRVRRQFDLNADPLEIRRCLGRDPELAALVERKPGLRVPGAWDPFEIVIRGIVGQQISVAGATTVLGKIVQRFGAIADGRHYFPTPESLAGAEEGELPMPATRAAAVRAVSRAVLDGSLDPGIENPAELVEQLTRIRGVGPWTAQYVAMRAASDPDAFLHGDLVLLRSAQLHLGVSSPAELLARAEAWRPWRAYAGIHLWAVAP
jgi:AraC family transcriptional regulator of adaptative response / DNA-3-methyladenine glycosylase II